MGRRLLCLALTAWLALSTTQTLASEQVKLEPEQKDRIQKFTSWIREKNDVSAHGVQFVNTKDRKIGLAASKQYSEGDVILEIPLRHVIWLRNALEDPVIKEIVDADIEGMSTRFTLVLQVAFALSDPNNKHAGWLQNVFSVPTNAAFFWADSDIKQVEGTELHDLIQSYKKDVKGTTQMFQMVKKLFPQYINFDVDEDSIRQILSAFHSRTLLATTNTGDKEELLIPLIDHVNFDPSPNVDVLVTGEVIQLVARQDILQGWELLLPVPVSSRDTLMYHGFRTENNVLDSVSLDIEFPDTDMLTPKRVEVLRKMGVTFRRSNNANIVHFELKRNQGLPVEVLIASRVRHLKANEFDLFPYNHNPVTVDNEYLAFRSIMQWAQSSLSQMPTTIKQDKAILDNDPNAPFPLVAYRMVEKQIYQDIINAIKRAWMTVIESGFGNLEVREVGVNGSAN